MTMIWRLVTTPTSTEDASPARSAASGSECSRWHSISRDWMKLRSCSAAASLTMAAQHRHQRFRFIRRPAEPYAGRCVGLGKPATHSPVCGVSMRSC